MKNFKKIMLLLVSISCIIFVLCSCGDKDSSSQNNSSSDKDNTSEMKSNLKTAVSDMYSSAVYAESVAKANVSLWNPYGDGDIVYVESVYCNDATWNISKGAIFDSNIKNTIEDARNDLKSLNSAHSKFSSSNEKMIHWPDEMDEEKEIYDALYDAYLNLYNLAASPSGNYKNYSENTNSYVTEFITQYEKIQRYLD